MGYDIRADYAIFQDELPTLLNEHAGSVVVYHNRERVGVFDTFDEAVRHGAERYGLGNFIAQTVEEQVPTRMAYLLMV